jgi:preprotein translocase subunit SecG
MLSTFLYILFVLAAIVLIVVILLQEGRGGGFGQALGEHGQQTFGVAAKGIHRFTFTVAAIFLVSAILLHYINRSESSSSVLLPSVTPADPTQGLLPSNEPPSSEPLPGGSEPSAPEPK